MKSSAKCLLVLAVGLFLYSALGCSDQLSRSYYKRHPMSSQEVAAVWGDPVAVEKLDSGIERRVYKIQNPATGLKYRYFLITNGQVIASGVTDQGPEKSTQAFEQGKGFTPSDLSRAYYKKFPMTAEALDRIWGEPVHVDKLGADSERRVYEISDPYTDFRYRYFLVENGRVTASRISADKGFRKASGDRVQQPLEINEISNAYYRRHPMTVSELEKVWGSPIIVQESGMGLEKRIYKIANPYPSGFEFRYFIVDGNTVVSSGITDTVDLAQ